MNDDEMYARVSRITQEAEQVVRLTREGVSDARAAIAGLQGNLKSGEGPVQTVVADLRGTLASTRSAMSDLAENTEALKRNFLFRGYFEDRGYYDLNELTPSDYREGALAGKYRQPIRIWLRADRLMSPGTPAKTDPTDAGAVPRPSPESLSNEGRLRLDQAMAELLRYPRNSPLVIEGYALADTRDERFLRAADRARQVREYRCREVRRVTESRGHDASWQRSQGQPGWESVGWCRADTLGGSAGLRKVTGGEWPVKTGALASRLDF